MLDSGPMEATGTAHTIDKIRYQEQGRGAEIRRAALLLASKQFGDACEMLVAAHLTLAGLPATIMPDGWPDYDVTVQRTQGRPQGGLASRVDFFVFAVVAVRHTPFTSFPTAMSGIALASSPS